MVCIGMYKCYMSVFLFDLYCLSDLKVIIII